MIKLERTTNWYRPYTVVASGKEYLLENIHFYEMHIFKYSKRQGTRAAVMKNQIPEQTKTHRSGELIALGNRMSMEFREYYLGKEEEVLFEELSVINGKNYYTGYTKEYVKVAKASEENLENRLITGVLTEMLSDEVYLMA
jgi:threonylcarbamoyladenosine tRNA methylthiotransferase MtaB